MTTREAEWSALLIAAMEGDGRAYARFLGLVTPVLRGIVRARGRVLGPEAQEDVVQEVLIAIHTKRHTWDQSAPLLPWLYAVTRHKVVDAFRRRGGAVHLPIEDFADALEAQVEGDGMAARDSAVLIGRLDARSADIVRAVSLDGQSTAEVGARLSMSEGAVRVALHRAIRRMAEMAKGLDG
ncbi:MAG: sigma-70 family RNA polymerase sigma factor [Rhodobacteraceae bacterium]|nr:sigma-70 family RNA polymerase sigma factor [Paracoccaceae bacterium]